MNTKRDIVKHETEKPERVEQRRTYAPAVDIFENNEEILMVADMPGVELKDISINFEKSNITMEGACACLPEQENDKGFVYTRTFTIPSGVDADKINADLKHGVLTVHLPKHDSLRTRQISVRAG